ncbi:hypothetical protein [Salinisphaera hydrothermalis]|uniref:hypothetical protein n=1 Tax=Salinisphaera hydrothermalis TaxID=563188 RepID=UPI00333EA5F9
MNRIVIQPVAGWTYKTLGAGVMAAGLLTLSGAADAESFDGYQIYSPSVTQGETEIEARQFYYGDSDNTVNQTNSGRIAIAHAFTSYWATELYGVYESKPKQSPEYAVEWENRFQLTPTGKYWLDVGALLEIEREALGERNEPFNIQYGVLLQKQVQQWVATLNVTLENQIGPNASGDTELLYRGRLSYRLGRRFQPDVEFYSAPGPLSEFEKSSEQQHQIGPGFAGSASLGSGSSFNYSTAVLFGATSSSPDVTPVVRLEYEFF